MKILVQKKRKTQVFYFKKMNNPCKNLAFDIVATFLKMTDEGFTFKKVAESIQLERIAICENCPSDKFDDKKRQCTECCCFMDFKTKLEIDPIKGFFKTTKTTCPLGHW